MPGRSVLAAVLAAGAGRRFVGRTHKLLAPFGDTTVVGAAVADALAACVGPVVVIAGAVELSSVLPDDVEVVQNARWADGQATSLAAAVEAARARGAERLVIGLGDQPRTGAAAWRLVAAAAGPVVVATFGGRRSPPVGLDREVWPLLPNGGDAGARRLMAEQPALVTEVACPGDPLDIDTVEDLPAWS